MKQEKKAPLRKFVKDYQTSISGALAILIPLFRAIGAVVVPNTFTTGDVLTATKLNENFTALQTEVNKRQGTHYTFGSSSFFNLSGQTRYLGVGADCTNILDEVCRQQILRDGTITKAEIKVDQNNDGTNVGTVKLLKNGTQIGSTMTVPTSSQRQKSSQTLDIAVTTSDYLQVQVVTPAGQQTTIGPFLVQIEVY